VRRRPPIVLLFPDQLRADALGAVGNRFVRTPNIDRLAAESVRFDVCITNAPLCRPARVTLMTGQPVAAHGMRTNLRAPDPSSLPSHVRRLRDEAGYHTVVVGKTHLHNGGRHLDDHRDVLSAWGFADAIELPDPQQHNVQSAHSDWLSSTTAKSSRDKFLRWKDYLAQHLRSADSVGLPPPDAAPWNLSTEDHLDSFCARAAANTIAEYKGDQPLYLQVNFPGPHPPFDPPSQFLAALDPNDAALPLPILEESSGPRSPITRRYRRNKRPRWSESDARALRTSYFGKVSLVDRGIGRVLQAIDDQRLADEAWIILTSDHGELLGDHHLTGKVLSYESAIRVPLLIRPPGGAIHAVDRGSVDLLDVVSTITDIAGLSPMELSGRSLADRVHGAGVEPSNGPGTANVFEAMGYVALRTARATLVWDREQGRAVELFDRARDPKQLHNAVADGGYQPLIAELLDQLKARVRL